MHRCLISFGANIGDAKSTVLFASQLLQQNLASGDRVELSRLYSTPPVGGPTGQPPFINAVAAVNTRLNPWEIWHVIRTIENQLGRQRQRRWEARRIDLDILLFDQQLVWTPQLKIPHPRMCMRRFILMPACDVAADWLDPVSQMTIGQLCSNLGSETDGANRNWLQDRVATASNDLPRPSEPPQPPLLTIAGQASLPLQQTILLAQSQLSPVPEIQAFRTMNLEELMSSARVDNDQAWQQLIGKLLIVWTDTQEGSAWEDQHRGLAIKLRLSPAVGNDERELPRNWVGPRYLLATSDPIWAAHEIAAAIEAMRCQITLA